MIINVPHLSFKPFHVAISEGSHVAISSNIGKCLLLKSENREHLFDFDVSIV